MQTIWVVNGRDEVVGRDVYDWYPSGFGKLSTNGHVEQ